MKKLLLIIALFSISYTSNATVHTVYVWDGYLKFIDANFTVIQSITIQLGDTVQWLPIDPPTMLHTITSTNIPAGAATFDYQWQLPADTFFQYVPQVPGVYDYVCTPHIAMGMVSSIIVESPTFIEEPDLANNFKIYPNPTPDFIRFEKLRTAEEYRIYNISGMNIQNGIADEIIDVSSLPKGIYFLDINADRKKLLKFIKE